MAQRPLLRVSIAARWAMAAIASFMVGGMPSIHALRGPQDGLPLLERYARGEFAAVERQLQTLDEDGRGDLLKMLKHAAPSWIETGGATDRARRRLAAATFALEAARAGEWDDWKLLQRDVHQDTGRGGTTTIVASDMLFWSAAPQLIEWGCLLLRGAEAPGPLELRWHLAALAVAQRSEDFEFLIGSPFEPRSDPSVGIMHLRHAMQRFPQETRFRLAYAEAFASRLFQQPPKSGATEAVAEFSALIDDPDVGGEAAMRLGIVLFRQRNYDAARARMDKAEELTRDPYVRYLARYVRGRILEGQHQTVAAEREYRTALAVMPRAQSASVALASLLAQRGRREEAARLSVDATRTPVAVDPWREHVHGDDRFWPKWIAALRAEFAR